jgi:integrase
MKVGRFDSQTTPWRVMVPTRYSADGKRKARYFRTKEDALAFCKETKKPGFMPADVKTQKETDHFGALVQMALSRLGDDPDQLIQAIKQQEKRLKLTPATVREAVEEFQRVRAGKVGQRTHEQDRWRLLKLIRAFEHRRMADVTETDLRRFFDELGTKINTRSVHKTVRVFFDWAKQYNYVVENPMLNIKPDHKFGINNDTYSPESFERMLRITAGLEAPGPDKEPTRDFADLLPWFILSGFCGLRSCEAYRITRTSEAIRWSDLYFDRGWIHIRKEVAKPNTPARNIERQHALAAAQSWLALANRERDFVVPCCETKIRDLKREFTKATGIKFVENGLRNSFASYALTYTGLDGVGKLALEMGNSEAICKRHYIQTLEPGTGQAWFGIRPTPANVIPIAAAA